MIKVAVDVSSNTVATHVIVRPTTFAPQTILKQGHYEANIIDVMTSPGETTDVSVGMDVAVGIHKRQDVEVKVVEHGRDVTVVSVVANELRCNNDTNTSGKRNN